jgi:hypothetical protein
MFMKRKKNSLDVQWCQLVIRPFFYHLNIITSGYSSFRNFPKTNYAFTMAHIIVDMIYVPSIQPRTIDILRKILHVKERITRLLSTIYLMHLKLSMPRMILVPFMPQVYDILQRLWLVKLNYQKIRKLYWKWTILLNCLENWV